MGVVYRAHDIHLNRTVAAKVLPAEKVADPARRERFVREARAASALNHPNIVTIHDIRSADGIDFIVMEYVEGRTLDEADLRTGCSSQAPPCAVQIADALARAHGAGILHRDIKPSNVMLTREGRVKVLDFGLAKLADPVESSPDAATMARPLTEAGVVVGTAAYMSPEQAEGREARRPQRHLQLRRGLLRDVDRPEAVHRRLVARDSERDPERGPDTAPTARPVHPTGSGEGGSPLPAEGPRPPLPDDGRPESGPPGPRNRFGCRVRAGGRPQGAPRVAAMGVDRARPGGCRRRVLRVEIPARSREHRSRFALSRSRHFPAWSAIRRSRPTATKWRSRGTGRSRTTRTSTCRESGRARPFGSPRIRRVTSTRSGRPTTGGSPSCAAMQPGRCPGAATYSRSFRLWADRNVGWRRCA